MRIFYSVVCYVFFTTSVCAQTATGSWGWKGGAGSFGSLSTYQEKLKVRFQLELSRGAPSYNSGYIEGKFLIRNGKGSFKTLVYDKICQIDFHFKRKEVILSAPENSDCGFGYNVYAPGTYKLISHEIPEFNIEDPRFSNSW